MLTSGSDRVGGLDFQSSATEYVARDETAELAELIGAVESLEAGRSLPPALSEALTRGTSIGGARPKVTLLVQGRHLIVKLPSTGDYYPVVKAEAAGMILARRVGLDVAACEVIRCAGRDVLLVERFDRTAVLGQRRMMVSALTILGEDEMGARHAGYPDLADAVRKQFTDAAQTLRELFARMVFNVCIGNTDDHLRNHAAFWDGTQLSLTPAYDLCPQPRGGETANQALNVTRTPGERASQLRLRPLHARLRPPMPLRTRYRSRRAFRRSGRLLLPAGGDGEEVAGRAGELGAGRPDGAELASQVHPGHRDRGQRPRGQVCCHRE